MNINGFHHFALVVTDIDRSVRWYDATLGFAVEARWEIDDGAVKFAHVAGHGVRFELFEVAGATAGPDEQTDVSGALSTRGAKHVGLLVDDIEAVRDALEAARVEILLGPNDVPQARVRNLFVRDPDGHQIEFVQWQDGSA